MWTQPCLSPSFGVSSPDVVKSNNHCLTTFKHDLHLMQLFRKCAKKTMQQVEKIQDPTVITEKALAGQSIGRSESPGKATATSQTPRSPGTRQVEKITDSRKITQKALAGQSIGRSESPGKATATSHTRRSPGTRSPVKSKLKRPSRVITGCAFSDHLVAIPIASRLRPASFAWFSFVSRKNVTTSHSSINWILHSLNKSDVKYDTLWRL